MKLHLYYCVLSFFSCAVALIPGKTTTEEKYIKIGLPILRRALLMSIDKLPPDQWPAIPDLSEISNSSDAQKESDEFVLSGNWEGKEGTTYSEDKALYIHIFNRVEKPYLASTITDDAFKQHLVTEISKEGFAIKLPTDRGNAWKISTLVISCLEIKTDIEKNNYFGIVGAIRIADTTPATMNEKLKDHDNDANGERRIKDEEPAHYDNETVQAAELKHGEEAKEAGVKADNGEESVDSTTNGKGKPPGEKSLQKESKGGQESEEFANMGNESNVEGEDTGEQECEHEEDEILDDEGGNKTRGTPEERKENPQKSNGEVENDEQVRLRQFNQEKLKKEEEERQKTADKAAQKSQKRGVEQESQKNRRETEKLKTLVEEKRESMPNAGQSLQHQNSCSKTNPPRPGATNGGGDTNKTQLTSVTKKSLYIAATAKKEEENTAELERIREQRVAEVRRSKSGNRTEQTSGNQTRVENEKARKEELTRIQQQREEQKEAEQKRKAEEATKRKESGEVLSENVGNSPSNGGRRKNSSANQGQPITWAEKDDVELNKTVVSIFIQKYGNLLEDVHNRNDQKMLSEILAVLTTIDDRKIPPTNKELAERFAGAKQKYANARISYFCFTSAGSRESKLIKLSDAITSKYFGTDTTFNVSDKELKSVKVQSLSDKEGKFHVVVFCVSKAKPMTKSSE